MDQCTFGAAPRNGYAGLRVETVKDAALGVDLHVSTHLPKSVEAPQKNVFIYSHANSEDLQLCETWLDDLAAMLESVVVGYDYPGYGETAGRPSEEACRKAAATVFEFTAEKYPDCRIFLWGRSVGTVPTLALGAREGDRVSAVILESGMASAGDVACKRGCAALSDKLNNLGQIKQLPSSCPVLIVHGKQDDDVPYRNALLLFDAVRAGRTCAEERTEVLDERKNELRTAGNVALLTLEDGQHNDLDTYCVKEMMGAAIRWLRETCGGFEGCSVESRNARTLKKSKAKRAEMIL